MKFNTEVKNKICFLVSTFDEREKFLAPFLYFYKKFIGPELRIYLAKGEKKFICNEDINIKQLNFSVSRTNKNLGLCSSWGGRLKKAIEVIRQDGFSYIIFTCDDGWIRSFYSERLSLVLEKMKQYNCDRIQLLETSPGYILEEIDQEVSLISPKSDVPWYLNHQTSIWKINSLDSVVTSNDCATVSEMVGSERCKELKYKFYVLNKPLTLSSGVNHSIDGLYEHGKIMLQEFCREKNISYVDYLKKFKISKIKKLIANFKSILIKIFKKIKYVRDN